MPALFQEVRVARLAMATRFEFVLHGGNPATLRAAGEEALDEVDRLEDLLSLYRPHSDIARINASSPGRPVRVAPETFRLLERARELCARTDGAFDVTAGPLVRAWGFHGEPGASPDPDVLGAARRRCGWERVVMDASTGCVGFDGEAGLLDLGGIGKGYALDRAVGILREAGVTTALLHGGTSTVVGIGTRSEATGWRVALARWPGDAGGGVVTLHDESLSVSAVWGRSFAGNSGSPAGHVMDPRSGVPLPGTGTGTQMAAVALRSAADADAVSTALLVLGEAGVALLSSRFPGLRTWLDAGADPSGARGG
ncbi:MAG: FAD:protein FMN transferase [Verrucomicrobiae bacterium]|nr:FAD:protein FMN transferase [Verrucomicrobiae bacterium]